MTNIFEIIKNSNIDELYLRDIGFDTSKKSQNCKIHGGDNKTAFQIDLVNKTYTCHTKKCVNKSDIIEVCRVHERLEKPIDAVKFLAEKYNIDLPKSNKKKTIGKKASKKKAIEIDEDTLVKDAVKEAEGDIELAMELIREKEEVASPTLYGPYKFDNNNGVLFHLKQTKDDDIEYIPIYKGYINIQDVCIDLDENKEMLNIVSYTNNRKSNKELSKGELTGKPQNYVIENLNNVRGFKIDPRCAKQVILYLYEQYDGLDTDDAFKITYKTDEIGFINKNKHNTFVYPNNSLSIDGNTFYKEDGRYNQVFTSKGSLNNYVNNVLKPLLKTDIGAITVSTVIASIIAEKLQIHELFVLDIYGKNGKGKTILLYALASIFGHANKYCLEWNSTKNAIISTASELKNFPLMLDDTKKCENKEVIAEVIYSLSGGKDKARANKDGSTKEVKTFKNIAITTGETSILNYIKGSSSGAGAFGRVLSLDTNTYNIFNNKEEADAIASNCKKNYGVLGVEFCKWLYQKLQEDDIEDNWLDLYATLKDINYRKIKNHTTIRKSNFIALLQVSATIFNEFLESIDADISINESIYNKFLKESDSLSEELDIYKKSFEAVIEYLSRNMDRVYEREKDGSFTPRGLIGWSKNDMYYIQDTNLLKSILEEYGDTDDILKEWKRRNYLETDNNKLQKTTRTPFKIGESPKNIKVYAINRKYYD